MSILFYNTKHYGDCFVSRSFIKDFVNKTNEKVYYAHNHKKNYLFNDINLIEVDTTVDISPYKFIFDTWYATENHKYFDKTGCTLQTLYKIFLDVYNKLGIPLSNISDYIPTIDYSKYGMNDCERNKNSVLVCTNKPLSSQSNSDDMSFFVNEMAKKMPEKTFFVTNDITNLEKRNNVFYTKDVLKENTLIELSWFSTQCSSIIGRSSGPYTFSLTKKNLDEGLKFFEITYSDVDTDFQNCNFGLHTIGYNNFCNICARCNWKDIVSFMEKHRDNL
jgi:hypothetical protein